MLHAPRRAAFLLYNASMADENQGQKNERTRLTASNFESAVDKQIREAMERGEFDNLKNRGKPLDLARDPNVPEDWEMAFNLLKNAGFAPDWIETRAQVEREREKLFAPFRRFLSNPPAKPGDRARARDKLVEQFRAQAAELNRLIDTYNLKAPNLQVHLHRIRIEEKVIEFLRDAGSDP